MARFSGFRLLEGSSPPAGLDAAVAARRAAGAEYDAVIVGGGGHGLAAAYYLAAEHGITRTAVLEKGWIGGGNTGRNTTIIRLNYLFDASAQLYDHAVKLWEDLLQVLNYNVMYSPRGVMMLARSVHDVQVLKRHIRANWLQRRRQRVADAEEAKATARR